MNDLDISRYLYINLGYSAAGLVIGIALGYVIRDFMLSRQERSESGMSTKPSKAEKRTDLRLVFVGVVMIALSILSVWQGVVYQSRQAESLRCQADFNSRFIRVLAERSQLTEQDRTNLEDLVRDTIEAGTNAAALTAARQGFLDRKQAIDEVRQETQLPNPGEVNECG